LVVAFAIPGVAQTVDDVATIQSQIRDLSAVVEELRSQLSESRRESQELRKEVEALRNQVATKSAAHENIPALVEQQQLIEAKVDEQYQTKVASGSRYRVRLSGMALFNAASTRGTVDHIDSPMLAKPQPAGESGGSFGATLRQSIMSLEVFGPDYKGARTSGELQFDFYGGFPATPEGLTASFVRMRTAKFALDWKNTSIVAGQEAPFFSPLSPSSLATVGYPSFSSSGNLWTWTPQVAITRRIEFERGKLLLTGGILDPLTGEVPPSEYNRVPTAGERSRIPAIAFRLGGEMPLKGAAATAGVGSYYSRQNWGSDRIVDAWAVTTDWHLPVTRWFVLSGEAYRGRSIAGLGGGPNASVTDFRPLDSAGGWVQLKFKPVARVELNSAFGLDHGFRPAPIRSNTTRMFNVIYQPRSSLLFSLEYRRMRTVISSEPLTADHINLAAGVVF
jgi:hypothetical protein